MSEESDIQSSIMDMLTSHPEVAFKAGMLAAADIAWSENGHVIDDYDVGKQQASMDIREAARVAARRYMSEESDIQSSIMDMLTSHPNVSWCFVTTTGRVKISAGHGIKSRWVTLGMPGLPDIIGMLRDGISFGIEVKALGKKPSSEQLTFIRHANTHGGRYGWANNVVTAMGIIE